MRMVKSRGKGRDGRVERDGWWTEMELKQG